MRPFLDDYRMLGRQAPRVERVLAVGRAFLATTALAAIYLDPTEPARFAAVTYALLTAYAAYSVLVLVVVRRAAQVGGTLGLLAHGVDILWASALTLFTDAPVSPFFLFFLFALLSAAYRWGFRETLATAVVIVLIFLLQTAAVTAGGWQSTWRADGTFELNAIITRVAYLLLTGFLLGYLADQEKQFRAEMAATADAMHQPRVELGLGGSAAAVARLLQRMFGAAQVDVLVQEHENARTMLWHADAPAADAAAGAVRRLELDDRHRAAWLFDTPARTWCGRRLDGGRLTGHAVQPDSWSLSPVHVDVPDVLTDAREFTSLDVVDFGLAGEWRGRVILYDGADHGPTASRLHFLDTLADHITPALSNVFLLRRLRSRASAAERARVARELHDGAIQALIGIEMEAQALGRRAEREAPSVAGDIARIQGLLRREVSALREVMQALRPVDLDAPHQLPDVLATLVERFRRETGISAKFAADGSTATLPLPTAIGIVRIVQEALVNVRKHSRAANVLVRLEQRAETWVLSVDDDGRGFEFAGRRAGAELGRSLAGPSMIAERARAIGGHLSIDSRPGAGARIEVSFHG